ncbi:MAG TPA: FecR domain-containing protein [Prolixibacteraceae bacterium]|nr:FecR domain-containing protein [Prolixibacteraceae bacterium]
MENIQQLLKKYSEGEITSREMIELSEQLNDGQSDLAEKILSKDWKAAFESDEMSARNLKPLLHEIHHRIRLKETKPASYFGLLWRNFQQIAAIIVIPLLVALLVFSTGQVNHYFQPASFAEVKGPPGARTTFVLPDSSTGVLNSGSVMKFPVAFTNLRTVELMGEAYFNIPSSRNPFHIITRNLKIEAAGNSLNVTARENENTEEVVIQTGNAHIYSKDGEQLAFLSSNEQLIFDIEKQTITTLPVDAARYSEWKEGRLTFRNEDIKQVVQKLSRWYNAEVIWVDDPLHSGYNIQATFVDEPLDEVLKVISSSAPLTYEEEKRLADAQGVYPKRKIKVQAHPSKMSLLK